MVLLVNVSAENAAKPQNISPKKLNNIYDVFKASGGNILLKTTFNWVFIKILT
jgi:hypothetical protein